MAVASVTDVAAEINAADCSAMDNMPWDAEYEEPEPMPAFFDDDSDGADDCGIIGAVI
jgi:hypothetical protein